MRYLFCILCFVILSCNPNKDIQLPENFKKVIAQKPFTLVISYSTECPVCVLYTSVLSDITRGLPTDSFQTIFLKVNSDEIWDFLDTSNSFQHQKPKVIEHQSLEIAKSLSIEIFPEIVVLDDQGKIYYKGAIDSRVKEIGNTHFRPAKSEEYLKMALMQIQKHEPVSIQNHPAKGCYIEFGKKP